MSVDKKVDKKTHVKVHKKHLIRVDKHVDKMDKRGQAWTRVVIMQMQIQKQRT